MTHSQQGIHFMARDYAENGQCEIGTLQGWARKFKQAFPRPYLVFARTYWCKLFPPDYLQTLPKLFYLMVKYWKNEFSDPKMGLREGGRKLKLWKCPLLGFWLATQISLPFSNKKFKLDALRILGHQTIGDESCFEIFGIGALQKSRRRV